jgi:hypothetical protein
MAVRLFTMPSAFLCRLKSTEQTNATVLWGGDVTVKKQGTFASGKFSWVSLALLLLAGHLGPAYLRNLCFRGVIIPVTMRSLALGLQAALFIDSRLFIPMLHIVLLRPL